MEENWEYHNEGFLILCPLCQEKVTAHYLRDENRICVPCYDRTNFIISEMLHILTGFLTRAYEPRKLENKNRRKR